MCLTFLKSNKNKDLDLVKLKYIIYVHNISFMQSYIRLFFTYKIVKSSAFTWTFLQYFVNLHRDHFALS